MTLINACTLQHSLLQSTPSSNSIMASTINAAASSAADEAWKTSDNPMDFCDVIRVAKANKQLRCKLCKKEFMGTGSRAYDHLIID